MFYLLKEETFLSKICLNLKLRIMFTKYEILEKTAETLTETLALAEKSFVNTLLSAGCRWLDSQYELQTLLTSINNASS